MIIIDFLTTFAGVFMAQVLIELSKWLIERFKQQTKTIHKRIIKKKKH